MTVAAAEELRVSLVVDPWLRDLLVDPISKQPFVEDTGTRFVAPCGLSYGYCDGVPDFRVRMPHSARDWARGQEDYECWFDDYLDVGERDPDFYARELENNGPLYEALKLSGRVLDVGGGLGHVRQYMDPAQEYCSIDPFTTAAARAAGRERLFESYPLSAPLNLLGGYAEFLPLADGGFDTVNMRSCIDHFSIPELALLEAFRVLRTSGRLIVGMTVDVPLPPPSLRLRFERARRRIRPAIGRLLGRDRHEDHHMWHPTYDALMALCGSCGFDLENEVWESDVVIYASFTRRSELGVAGYESA